MRRPLRTFIALCFLVLALWPLPSPSPIRVETVSSVDVTPARQQEGRELHAVDEFYATVATATTTTVYSSQQGEGTESVGRQQAARRGAPHRGYATAKECVMWVENGGDYGRSTNPSHFGRYQFDRQTWAAYGGDPDTWGSASPAEQDAVFERAWATPGGPEQGWLRWDGCGPL